MPAYALTFAECDSVRRALKGATHRVEADHVQLEVDTELAKLHHRGEQRGLILHRIDVANVQQPRGLTRISTTWCAWRPIVEERNADRHDLGVDS